MKNEEKLAKLTEDEYQELFGVKKATFDAMLKILEVDYERKHQKGGRTPTLSVLDKLIIMLQYYREYRSMRHIAFDYGVVKSTVCDAVAWAEQTLIKSGMFRLPSKRKLLEKGGPLETVIVDATECGIGRPEKNRKNITLGRRKDTHSNCRS